jgi:transposase-like protein
LYFRFALSYRDVEDLLAERGVLVTYESVRQWCRKFGQNYANELRRRRPRPGDTWHLRGGGGSHCGRARRGHGGVKRVPSYI